MTKQTFERAQEINKKLKELDEVITKLCYLDKDDLRIVVIVDGKMLELGSFIDRWDVNISARKVTYEFVQGLIRDYQSKRTLLERQFEEI